MLFRFLCIETLFPTPISNAAESNMNISWYKEIGLLCADASETESCAGNGKGGEKSNPGRVMF